MRCISIFGAAFLVVRLAGADDIPVLNLADSGAGSLRQAILDASETELTNITFARELSGSTIRLTSGELVIDKEIEIEVETAGPNALRPITISGNDSSRIFNVKSGGNLGLTGLILSGGRTGGDGGAISNDGTLRIFESTIVDCEADDEGGGITNDGDLELDGVTFRGNEATDGGGLFTQGSVFLNACLFVANSASEEGGGLFVDRGTDITNCTFTENSAEERGGAIKSYNDLKIEYCTITGNSAPLGGAIHASNDSPRLHYSIAAGNGDSNFAGRTIREDGKENITETRPALLDLGDYGGPTQTMPAVPSEMSPVIDKGEESVGLEFDQRGQPRVFGEFADLGAVEYQGDEQEDDIRFDADTDGDGTTNGLEEALGRDPDVADPYSPNNPRVSISNGKVLLFFGYNESTRNTTTMYFQASTDLEKFGDEFVYSNDDFVRPDNGGLYTIELDVSEIGERVFYRVGAIPIEEEP